MTNLEKLEADIREKLPRLMDLTEGCEISYLGKRSILLTIDKDEDYCKIIEDGIAVVGRGFNRLQSKCSIIGHHILLSDVLEWIHIGGKKSISGFADDYLNPNNNNPVWDLSKPYLKDQPQKLIDYLAGLI